jgi:asparagine synthase (glutamine-hydrolysing)
MCGISGYYGYEQIAPEVLKNTLELMKNRGPDYSAFIKRNNNNKILYLLHSRLSIIDLDTRANQPFSFGPYSIIFNGEIYNYREIKSQLILKNYKFLTESDTEVLLYAYIEFGEKCLDLFEGMWSIVIWDDKNKKLFISRDRFGEKPLFYLKNNSGFYFASEIKFIHSLLQKNISINEKKIKQNLYFGYKSLHCDNDTFYKKIKEFKKGTYLKIDFKNNFSEKKYWSPNLKFNNRINYNDAKIHLNTLLLRSLNLRLRSDVPVAFLLSGGIDSTTLVSYAKKKTSVKFKTFSIVDPSPNYNEQSNINYTVRDLNLKHEYIYIKRNKNFLSNLSKIVKYHDSPLSTISYYYHSLLVKKISEQGFKVTISGTGSDEIFSGYYHHFLFYFNTIKNFLIKNSNISDWKKNVSHFIRSDELKNISSTQGEKFLNYENNSEYGLFDEKNYLKNLIFKEKKIVSDKFRNRMLNELFYEIVPVILYHDDMNSMYYSMENRSPFLDKKIFEFIYSLPNKYLASNGFLKKILRDTIKDVVNDNVRLNYEKVGFNGSLDSLVDIHDKSFKEFLYDNLYLIKDFINVSYLKKFIGSNYNSIKINNKLSKFIFTLLNTIIFIKNSKYNS